MVHRADDVKLEQTRFVLQVRGTLCTDNGDAGLGCAVMRRDMSTDSADGIEWQATGTWTLGEHGNDQTRNVDTTRCIMVVTLQRLGGITESEVRG